MKDFMTSKETQESLGISYPTFLRRIKDGTIPHVKLGTRLLIPSSYIKGLLTLAETDNHEKTNTSKERTKNGK